MADIFRIAAISSDLHVADPYSCVENMKSAYADAVKNGASLALFPAFAVCGKSCGALFQQPYLLEHAEKAAEIFAASVCDVPAIFGMPKLHNGKLLECAAVAVGGKIEAFVVRKTPDLPYFCGDVPADDKFFQAGQVFSGNLTFSVNFASDSDFDTSAQLQLFCGAEPEIPGSWLSKKNLYTSLSSLNASAAAAAYSGSGESTGDNVYGGGLIICCRGEVCSSRPSPALGSGMIFSDIDCGKIAAAQLRKKSAANASVKKFPAIPLSQDLRFFSNPQHPFLPNDPEAKKNMCRESFALQTIGLGERFKRCHAEKMVIGISGGLDSTLALTVLAMVCKEYRLPAETIIAVTMPGFGTTSRTRNNAVALAELIGAEIREIPITASCLQHFHDIGHDPSVRNSVYENTQARERTQILMDIANEVNGIVIGTGDLSEIALGWSTFNGDQMAMYSVNSSIPKSNITAMLEYACDIFPEARQILQDVADTPVSPELLPPDENDGISQKTETILGAYELHDYYLYHFVNGTSSPEDLLMFARDAFNGKYPDAELIRVRDIFLKRFFTQQFKRTAGPDGVQAGEVSLSARSSWQMNADIDGNLWRK